MSAVTIQIRVDDKGLEARLGQYQKTVLAKISKEMDAVNLLTVGHIQRARLTGKGPFPAELGKLGVVTGRLRGSANATAAKISGNQVASSIGTNVRYAAIHEFGFTGVVKVKPHRRKVAGRDVFRGTDAGEEQVASGVGFVGAHARNLRIPARAPFRRGIEDKIATYEAAFTRVCKEAIAG